MASLSDDMPEDPTEINVKVQWCGISYSVNLPPEANVHELKRRTCEVAGLPSKRQKHTEEPWADLNDDHPVSLLPIPRMTRLIGLNEKPAAEIYKESLYAIKPKCTVKATKDRLEDFGKSKTRLYKGTYKVGCMEMACLVKCYNASDKADLVRSIELMRNLSHPNIVTMENLYKERGNTALRLVLSNNIDGSLEKYIKASVTKEEDEMPDTDSTFTASIKKEGDAISNADGTFTIFFERMILDLCAVLDQMVKHKICPVDLDRGNLYLKKMENAEPQLRILFNKVDLLHGPRAKHMLTSLCQNIKDICTPSVHKDVGTEAFCNFLGKEAINFLGKNLTRTAMSYPINWSTAQKAKYLMDLIPCTGDVGRAINRCGIKWPINAAGDMCEELQHLNSLVDEANDNIKAENEIIMLPFERKKERIESEETNEKIKQEKLKAVEAKSKEAAKKPKPQLIWNYDPQYPKDLVRLTRNLWKHFDTYPSSIKTYLKDKDATLANLERWCPNVWVLIYNAVGLGY